MGFFGLSNLAVCAADCAVITFVCFHLKKVCFFEQSQEICGPGRISQGWAKKKSMSSKPSRFTIHSFKYKILLKCGCVDGQQKKRMTQKSNSNAATNFNTCWKYRGFIQTIYWTEWECKLWERLFRTERQAQERGPIKPKKNPFYWVYTGWESKALQMEEKTMSTKQVKVQNLQIESNREERFLLFIYVHTCHHEKQKNVKWKNKLKGCMYIVIWKLFSI